MARFEEEPHVNPNTRTREFSVRDPDGYYVTVSALPRPSLANPRNLTSAWSRRRRTVVREFAAKLAAADSSAGR